MNCTAFTYYVTLTGSQTHVCLIASSVKIITKCVAAVVYRFKSARIYGFMLRLICMFLGCDMPIQLVLSSEYDDYDRLEDRFIVYRFMSRPTKIYNILCLNK